MSKRWLSSALIFALGCLFLVTNATAQEPPPPADTGELEHGLTYINTERESTLVNTGKDIYLVMVQREPGTAPAEEPISYNGEIVIIPKVGLIKAVAYRLVPIGVLADELWRSCAMGDCSWIGPFPPPPPPQPHPNPEDVKAKISMPQK
jgi:hypothetical protein